MIDHWTLTGEEIILVNSVGQTDYNRLGCGLLLKYFQREGKFPQRKQDIPSAIVEHLAHQLQVPSTAFADYKLQGRTVRRHQLRIRQLLKFRVGTVDDAKAVLAWLGTQNQLLEEHNVDRLKEVVFVSRLKESADPLITEVYKTCSGNSIDVKGKKISEILPKLKRTSA